MSPLYNREVVLSVSKPRGFFDNIGTATIFITKLRVSFEINKSLKKEPNPCEIVVYNLSERTRAELQKKPLQIRLDAGYAGDLSRLFVGDIIRAPSKKVETEWETTITAADGVRAFAHARVNRSFKSGVSVRDAVVEIARSMGLQPPINLDRPEFFKRYAGGLSLSGASNKQMTKILSGLGLEWSVQDGKLVILSSTDILPNEAVVISRKTGMIGAPELGYPKKNKGKPIATAQILLEPRIQPGRLVSIDARSVQGVFRVEKMSHSGDTFGKNWTTEVVESSPVSVK